MRWKYHSNWFLVIFPLITLKFTTNLIYHFFNFFKTSHLKPTEIDGKKISTKTISFWIYNNFCYDLKPQCTNFQTLINIPSHLNQSTKIYIYIYIYLHFFDFFHFFWKNWLIFSYFSFNHHKIYNFLSSPHFLW